MIVWSDESKLAYEHIIDDILEKWNIEVAFKFEELTNNLLDRLILNNRL